MSRYLDNLAKKISDKAHELGGVTQGSTLPVVTVTFHPDVVEWQAWVPVEPGSVAAAMRPTIQEALQVLAREVGAL